MFVPIIALVLCLASTSQRSFVATAPLNEGVAGDSTSTTKDSNVRELESLKHSLDKTLAMMKTHSSVYTNINGAEEGHADTQAQVSEDGKLIAKIGQHINSESKDSGKKTSATIRTNLDVPAKGIHKSVVEQIPGDYHALTENGNRRSLDSGILSESDNNVDNSVQYSPLDMAEYVFWTGDEKGVTLAIEEFLEKGVMTREEAISFLQEIKYNLDYLKNHYTQFNLNSRGHSKNQEPVQKYSSYEKTSIPSSEKPELRSSIDLNQLRQEINKKRDPELSRTGPIIQHKASESDKSQDEDYDELLERLRVADFLYTEYSLEEVIYQLAKVMFTQSLTRGSAEAQQALQKFTNFLEIEAEQGHISRSLEKKVLDVLIAALSDTFGEHPELLSGARDNIDNTGGQHFLRQILEINPDDKASVRSVYKDQNGRNLQEQMKLVNRVPLGLGKYKNP